MIVDVRFRARHPISNIDPEATHVLANGFSFENSRRSAPSLDIDKQARSSTDERVVVAGHADNQWPSFIGSNYRVLKLNHCRQ